eukprot:CFRG2520T1
MRRSCSVSDVHDVPELFSDEIVALQGSRSRPRSWLYSELYTPPHASRSTRLTNKKSRVYMRLTAEDGQLLRKSLSYIAEVSDVGDPFPRLSFYNSFIDRVVSQVPGLRSSKALPMMYLVHLVQTLCSATDARHNMKAAYKVLREENNIALKVLQKKRYSSLGEQSNTISRRNDNSVKSVAEKRSLEIRRSHSEFKLPRVMYISSSENIREMSSSSAFGSSLCTSTQKPQSETINVYCKTPGIRSLNRTNASNHVAGSGTDIEHKTTLPGHARSHHVRFDESTLKSDHHALSQHVVYDDCSPRDLLVIVGRALLHTIAEKLHLLSIPIGHTLETSTANTLSTLMSGSFENHSWEKHTKHLTGSLLELRTRNSTRRTDNSFDERYTKLTYDHGLDNDEILAVWAAAYSYVAINMTHRGKGRSINRLFKSSLGEQYKMFVEIAPHLVEMRCVDRSKSIEPCVVPKACASSNRYKSDDNRSSGGDQRRGTSLSPAE